MGGGWPMPRPSLVVWVVPLYMCACWLLLASVYLVAVGQCLPGCCWPVLIWLLLASAYLVATWEMSAPCCLMYLDLPISSIFSCTLPADQSSAA
jgi:hypothetical protein